jgi:hypothetical protein
MKMIKQPAKKTVKRNVGDKVIVEEYCFDGRTTVPIYTRATITKINRITMHLEDENGYGILFDPRECDLVAEEEIAAKAMQRQEAMCAR